MFREKDSQDDRRWQWLTDQHGRTWGCTIELATGDPVGPIDLYDAPSGKVVRAPVMPPAPFLRVDSKRAHGLLKIDYTGWKASRRQAWDDYRRRMLGIAQQMYKEDAAQKVEDPPPALVSLVGIPPERVEPIEAAEYGDEWALGLSDVRPDWADVYIPPEHTIVKRAERAKGRPAFLDYQKPGKQEAKADEEYPVMYGPGRWRLSDGSTMQGKKTDALAAEAELGETHPSWE